MPGTFTAFLDLAVDCDPLKFGHVHFLQRELHTSLLRVDFTLEKQENRLSLRLIAVFREVTQSFSKLTQVVLNQATGLKYSAAVWICSCVGCQ